MAPYYEAVRPSAPQAIGNIPLQGQARPTVGSDDLAFPGGVIQGTDASPSVSADHIVPLSEILTLPGFWQLNARNMLLIINAPSNYQWLSYRANQSKQSRSVARMKNADPVWIQGQLDLRDTSLTQLQQAISLMLQQQQTAGG